MQNTIQIECPQEVLLSLHADAGQFAELMKLQTALYLFKEHKITSGTAASWLGMERVRFLTLAMEAGAVLLDDTEDDFQREVALTLHRKPHPDIAGKGKTLGDLIGTIAE